MCLASKYLIQLEAITTNLDNDKRKLLEKLSEYDKRISNFYHRLETANFNACEGFYFSKELQTLLRERRVIKDEYSKLNSLKQILGASLSGKNVNRARKSIVNQQNKEAHWRQNWSDTYAIEEILH